MRRTLVRGLSRRSRRWSVLTRISPGSPCRRVHPLTNIRDLGEAARSGAEAHAARQYAHCRARLCLARVVQTPSAYAWKPWLAVTDVLTPRRDANDIRPSMDVLRARN